MVGHHEPAINAAPAPRAAQLHPAAREGIGVVAKAFHPWRALRRRRREHQCALEHLRIHAFVGHPQRRRQRHTRGAVDRVQRLDRAMNHDRADRRIDAMQDTLRLAERIAQQHRRAARVGISSPPVVDLGVQLLLRRPAIDRQAEGRFGDESVARHWLERRAGAVGLRLVIARRDPDPASVLKPDLRGAQYMARRMQRQFHAVVRDRLAISQRLQIDVGAEANTQRAFAMAVRQIMTVAGARMVRVRMRDDRAVYRFPRLDVKVAGGALQALRARDDQIHRLMLATTPAAYRGPAKKPQSFDRGFGAMLLERRSVFTFSDGTSAVRQSARPSRQAPTAPSRCRYRSWRFSKLLRRRPWQQSPWLRRGPCRESRCR